MIEPLVTNCYKQKLQAAYRWAITPPDGVGCVLVCFSELSTATSVCLIFLTMTIRSLFVSVSIFQSSLSVCFRSRKATIPSGMVVLRDFVPVLAIPTLLCKLIGMQLTMMGRYSYLP